MTHDIERDGEDHWYEVETEDGQVVLRVGGESMPTITLRESPERAENLAEWLKRNARSLDADTDRSGGSD